MEGRGWMAVLGASAALAHAAEATAEIVLVSRAADGGAANRLSQDSALSADGRYVAFTSAATNLVPGDSNGAVDTFRRDVLTGTTVLVSVSASGGPASGSSQEPAISADGRFVAFATNAKLAAGDVNDNHDIYLRDVAAGTTELVSSGATDPAAPFFPLALRPAISGDGRYVAYQEQHGRFSVYLRDRTTGTTRLVSGTSGGDRSNGESTDAAVTNDGRVLFGSGSTDLVPEPGPAFGVFLREPSGAITRVSRRADGTPAIGSRGTISRDGRWVAYLGRTEDYPPSEPGAPPGVLVVRDLVTGAVEVASRDPEGAVTGAGDPVLAGGGRAVAWTATSPAGRRMVLARDLAAGSTVTMSAPPGGAAPDGDSLLAAISDDGAHVAFTSLATNLVPDDGNGATSDVFLAGRPAPAAPPAPRTVTIQKPPPHPPPPECANGRDDDRDGFADARDPQCAAGRGREAPRDNPLLACAGRRLALTDVLPAGARVRIAGLADPALHGLTVEILQDGRRVGRARVTAAGSFATLVRARNRGRGRFQAVIGDLRSLRLKLDRKTIDARAALTRGRIVVTGRVLRRAPRAIVELLVRAGGCGTAYRSVARARLGRDGRFRISAAAPAGVDIAVYRARIRLGRGRVTFTLPRAVALR